MSSIGNILDKVELHVHLDGSLRIESILDIAKKRGVPLPANTPEDLKNYVTVWERPGNFAKFIKTFGVFLPVIAGDREAIWRMAYEFCEDCSKESICYVEARYSPHLLANDLAKPANAPTRGDLGAKEVVRIVNEAFKKGSHDFGITVNSIICCIVGEPDWGKDVLSFCEEFRDDGVVGMDIAFAEHVKKESSDTEQLEAFQEAYKRGIHRTVHAGETGDAESVWTAVELLRAERIGHGYHLIDDPVLYEKVTKKDVHFEICPNSAILTGSIPQAANDLMSHAAIKFAQDGVNFSVNRDDPLVFQNTLDDEFRLLQEMGFTTDQIVKTIFNGAHSIFGSQNEKQCLLARLEKCYKRKD